MLVTFVLGSIHAFSIFIHSLETLLGESRGNISLVYSMALVCLTLFVLLGYRFYRLLSPASIVIASCGGAALGMLITALAQQLWQVFVGYNLIFGAANGLGYGFILQLVAREITDHKGFAMGGISSHSVDYLSTLALDTRGWTSNRPAIINPSARNTQGEYLSDNNNALKNTPPRVTT